MGCGVWGAMLGVGNYGTLDLSVALRNVRDVTLRGNMGLGGGGGLDERDVAVDADSWKKRGWEEGRKAGNGRCSKSEEMAGTQELPVNGVCESGALHSLCF